MLFDKKAYVLDFVQEQKGEYIWQKSFPFWVRLEHSSAKSIFSQFAIGATGIKIYTNSRGIKIYNAILLEGKHYFVFDINEHDRQVCCISAVQITPDICTAHRNFTSTDTFNRPKITSRKLETFPAYLTEKWLRYEQEKPQSAQEICMLLITDKTIVLQAGDLVEIKGNTYNVRLCHLLDSAKNEYEILQKKEV